MIHLDRVLEIVKPHLGAIEAQERTEIVVTAAERVSGQWHVFYNTREFAESGDPLRGLVGNVPFAVGDDGSVGPVES